MSGQNSNKLQQQARSTLMIQAISSDLSNTHPEESGIYRRRLANLMHE